MDADAEPHDRLGARGAIHVQLLEFRAHVLGGPRRRGRAVARVAHRAEDRHEPVAEELIEDAAPVDDAARHDAKVRVQHFDDLLGRKTLGESGRAAQVGEEDRHRLTLAGKAQRIALDDALDDRRREETLEAATPVELDEQRTDRDDRRDRHEDVVLPPRGRPCRPEELRDLRLREEHVRRRERALHREARAQIVAALADRREPVEKHDRGREHVRQQARSAEHIGCAVATVAVARRVVVIRAAGGHEHPAREAAQRRRRGERDERVAAHRDKDAGDERARWHMALEPADGRCVADREEERRRPEREHRGDPDDERGAGFLRVALQHARRREAMHREDPGHGREAHRDEQRRVMTDLEGGTRDENGDRKRDERDVRRDDEVLDRDDPRRVRGRRRQEPREDSER